MTTDPTLVLRASDDDQFLGAEIALVTMTPTLCRTIYRAMERVAQLHDEFESFDEVAMYNYDVAWMHWGWGDNTAQVSDPKRVDAVFESAITNDAPEWIWPELVGEAQGGLRTDSDRLHVDRRNAYWSAMPRHGDGAMRTARVGRAQILFGLLWHAEDAEVPALFRELVAESGRDAVHVLEQGLAVAGMPGEPRRPQPLLSGGDVMPLLSSDDADVRRRAGLALGRTPPAGGRSR